MYKRERHANFEATSEVRVHFERVRVYKVIKIKAGERQTEKKNKNKKEEKKTHRKREKK